MLANLKPARAKKNYFPDKEKTSGDFHLLRSESATVEVRPTKGGNLGSATVLFINCLSKEGRNLKSVTEFE